MSGASNIRLGQHMSRQRNFFTERTKEVDNVPIEFPNEQSYVTYKLGSITIKDPEVIAGVTNVHQDESGKRRKF